MALQLVTLPGSVNVEEGAQEPNRTRSRTDQLLALTPRGQSRGSLSVMEGDGQGGAGQTSYSHASDAQELRVKLQMAQEELELV